MSAQIIDGKAIAATYREEIKNDVKALKEKGISVGLAVVLVGDDPASQVYVGSKIKACAAAGIISTEQRLDESATEQEVRDVIQSLNADKDVHGILLQLPLPKRLSDVQESLVQEIDARKDVDGLTTLNAGKLFLGHKDGLVPCTPQGSLRLIKSVEQNLSGKHAVVIGRSNLFGKPMAQLLLQENCTVTIAHSRTKDLASVCAQADILVAAVGRAEMVKADWVKEGAIVIDVGINRQVIKEDAQAGKPATLDKKTAQAGKPATREKPKSKLLGDVDFDAVSQVASAITPVPGGVGPMTIACLLANTVRAAG